MWGYPLPVSLLVEVFPVPNFSRFLTVLTKRRDLGGQGPGYEQGVKDVFLVFLLPFAFLSVPFWSNPALNQGVASQRVRDVSPINIPGLGERKREYHRFSR